MKFPFLLFIFLSLTSFQSYSVEIVKKSKRLVVSDSSCNEVQNIAHEILSWIRIEKFSNSCSGLSQPLVDKNGQCFLDVTDCVPKHIVQYHNKNPKFSGPNCWNLALVMKGILPALRYSTAEEMTFYMKSPLCRSLSNNEKRLPGDIGAIRTMENNQIVESHGFLYVSDKITYSKNNAYYEAPYALQDLETVYNLYHVPAKEECRTNELNLSTSCPSAVAFYRCSSMNDFLVKNRSLPKELITTLNEITDFEIKLQNHLLEGFVLDDSANRGFLNATKQLQKYLIQQQGTTNLSVERKQFNFILNVIQMRLISIADQLEYMGDIGFANELREKIQTIIK